MDSKEDSNTSFTSEIENGFNLSFDGGSSEETTSLLDSKEDNETSFTSEQEVDVDFLLMEVKKTRKKE